MVAARNGRRCEQGVIQQGSLRRVVLVRYLTDEPWLREQSHPILRRGLRKREATVEVALLLGSKELSPEEMGRQKADYSQSHAVRRIAPAVVTTLMRLVLQTRHRDNQTQAHYSDPELELARPVVKCRTGF